MGTLKHFYRNVLQSRLNFLPGINEDRFHSLELESHLATETYNGFTLPEAIRPSLDLAIIPQQGYAHETLETLLSTGQTEQLRSRRPGTILAASISAEYLFDTFLDLLNPLGSIVNVVLETSHGFRELRGSCLRREHIDLPILKSFLYDHEELLLNDGCTGITIIAPRNTAFVRFDEHKLVIIRAKSLLPFEDILQQNGVEPNESMEFLTDAEHIHITRDEYVQRFKALHLALGMDGSLSAAGV